ncbi:MAG: hypothetical protein Kow00127_19650 [Bacteroidales bacterium]
MKVLRSRILRIALMLGLVVSAAGLRGQVLPGFTYTQDCFEVTFTDTSQVETGTVITGYEWDFGDFTPVSNDPNPVHTYGSEGQYTVQLTVYYNNPSGQATTSGTVQVWTVSADFLAGETCFGFPTPFTSQATTGAQVSFDPDSLLWDFNNDGIFDASGTDVFYAYPNSGIYQVKFKAINTVHCWDEIVNDVTVLDQPVAGFTNDTACAGYPAHFTDTSMAFPDPGVITEWAWDFENDGTYDSFDQNPVYTFPAVGLFNTKLRIQTSNGCADSVVQEVFVAGPPVASFTTETTCSGKPVAFFDQSVPNAPGELLYEWDFGDMTPVVNDPNPVHTYATPGYYTVTLTVTNSFGCVDDTSTTLLFESPVAAFHYDTACFGMATFFYDETVSINSPIMSWQWDFGDGTGTSTVPSPNYTYSNPGIYPASLTVENDLGCVDDTVVQVVVDTLPVAGFINTPACQGLSVCFTDTSVANADSIISWLWAFGDGNLSNLQNPCHIYSDTGSYTVTMVVVNSNNCASVPFMKEIYVSPSLEVDFSFLSGCFGDTTYFTNLTDSLGVEIETWQWIFGDTASGIYDTSYLFQPGHLFTSPGQYTVQLEVTNIYGCNGVATHTVVVDSLPEAQFIAPDTISVGIEFEIEDISVGHGMPILWRNWDFGDGTQLQNPNPVIHQYDTTGVYHVCLTVQDVNSCYDEYCDSIVVMDKPTAQFDYASDVTLETFFYDQSLQPGSIVNWYWDFGDTLSNSDTISGIPQPTYIYPEEGWYQVYLKVWDKWGGTDETEQLVYAGNAVVASFDFQNQCIGDTTLFFDNSYSPISADVNNWYWNWGDGQDTLIFEKPDTLMHFFNIPGTYIVRQALSAYVWGNFMTDTLVDTVTIYEKPFVAIDTAGLNVCLGTPINFKDKSIYVPGDPGDSWLWDFDNGASDTLQNPVYNYPDTGDYHVMLTVTTQHGCTKSATRDAHVTFAPDFSFIVSSPCLGKPTTFIPDYDSSKIEITAWNWNFGDNLSPDNTSTEARPQHIYSRIDNYTVTMKMWSYGCKGESEETFLVYPVPYSDFTVTPDYGDIQGRVKFTNNSIFATSYLWDFGNGNQSSVADPVEVYEYDSTYLIQLIAYNNYPPGMPPEHQCADTSFYTLNIFFKGLYFPTAFSPNNPNDEISRFTPKGINLEEYHVEVFDLRGNLLWESDKLDENGSPVESWDGYFNGILMPQGTYIWKASGTFKDGSVWPGQSFDKDLEPKTNGTVTLIR